MTLALLLAFGLLMITGLPIGYALILASTVALVGVGELPGTIVMLRFFQPTQNFVMIAIPFFILSAH